MIPMASSVVGKANAHPKAIDNGGEHPVLAGEHLRTPQDNAVDHNQRQVDAQGARPAAGEYALNKHLHNWSQIAAIIVI